MRNKTERILTIVFVLYNNFDYYDFFFNFPNCSVFINKLLGKIIRDIILMNSVLLKYTTLPLTFPDLYQTRVSIQ